MARYKTFMTLYAEPETIEEYRDITRNERVKGRTGSEVFKDMVAVYKAQKGAA